MTCRHRSSGPRSPPRRRPSAGRQRAGRRQPPSRHGRIGPMPGRRLLTLGSSGSGGTWSCTDQRRRWRRSLLLLVVRASSHGGSTIAASRTTCWPLRRRPCTTKPVRIFEDAELFRVSTAPHDYKDVRRDTMDGGHQRSRIVHRARDPDQTPCRHHVLNASVKSSATRALEVAEWIKAMVGRLLEGNG